MTKNSDSGKSGKTSGGRTRKAGAPSARTDARRAGSQPRTTNGKSPVFKGAAGGGRPPKTQAELFPIVGIGASAGGLEALTELLKAMPDDPGIAVVYIQHMAPTHESMLPRLLAKATSMPVLEVTDGMKVQANHLYIIPPNAGLTISEGFLRLSVRKEGIGKILPIDDFFCALAEDQRTAAIGVILSGTASDGTLGLKAIKAEGGITFAQDSKSARFPDMPLSAVAAGCVDFTLPPDKIAAELSRMGRHPYIRAFKEAEPPQAAEGPDESLRKICLVLRSATGVDFHLYKPATIGRRVARRMALHRVGSRDKYLHLLRENRTELDALYEDIFIHVTGFFRDPEALVAVRHTVLPNILQERASDQAIRIWVPGCSSGEEVYSIAIMLLEELGERANQARIQIFGTDISERAIEHARAGIYSESSVAAISAERRRRFFVKVEGGYQISKFVRDMCVFARHDVTKDPPFSKLDIICCRNVLIYLGPVLQKRVAETFHYALKGSGYLVLGKSESLSAHANLFAMEDAKLKIFSRKPIPGPHYLNTTIAEFVKAERAGLTAPAGGSFDLRREAERLLLDQFVPPALVVDSDLQIVHFQGDTSRYLAPATGQPSFHLLRMVRPEAVVDLRTAIHEAKKTGSAVRREAVRIRHNGDYKTVDLQVLPLKGRHAKEIDFLIIFQETAERILEELPPLKGQKGKDKGPAGQRIEQLRRELGAAHEQLKTIIEEHEATSEEMTAVNEEVISSNEELQSTNEELETAKEELQSSNEELITLNDELQNRNSELGQLANDLSNLLVGVEIPIVILDSDLRIRRFTPVAEKVLNLISTDVGRPFTDLAPTLDVTDWKELIDQVVQSRSSVERDVRDRQGHWYGLRMRPYQTSEHTIDGILMALVDIDTIKRSLDEAREARDFAEAIVETVRAPLLILDEHMRVLKATRSYYETFRTSPEQTEGRGLFDLGGGSWNIPRLRELLARVLPRDSRVEAFEVTREFPEIGHRDMLLNAGRIPRRSGGKSMMLLAMEDVTERRQAEDVIRQRERVIQEATSHALVSAASDGRITMVNQRAAEMFGYSREELLNLTVEALLPASSREAHTAQRSAYLANPQSRAMASGLEVKGRRKDGSEFPISVSLSHIDTKDGAIAIDVITDLTERRKAEEALKFSQERLLLAQEMARIGLWDWDGQSGEVRHSRDCGPLYGLPRGAEVSTPEQWLAMVHPDDRARVLESRKRALEDGAPFSEEFRAVWPDGSVHWLQGRATVFHDPDGKAVRMVGVNVDITSRKKAEEERQMLLDRLANAQEEERRRISRELHDNLTQKLAGLAMDIGSLVETSRGSASERRRVRKLQTGVVQAAEAARHIAHELHPSELEDLGLAAALRAYCQDFRREGVEVEFTEHALHQTVSREVASCLYKVAQEGLRNIAKHGKTKQASVTLEGAEDRIRLRVEDRGSGFPVESLAGTAGLGIPTMKERVRLMNGNFGIHSKPGQGTQISVELPL